LEKIWDAFERTKTFYGSDKKDSVNQIIDLLSTELERSYLNKEFLTLTKVGNEYRIRHHETNKRKIEDSKLISYLFFRMLASIEKIWDAFERTKTFYGSDKKDSVNQIIDLLSTELERSYLNKEFLTLTKVGNEYRIRHHETNKRKIEDSKLISYLFFRMLALI